MNDEIVRRVDEALHPDEILALARRLVAIPSHGPACGWETEVGRALADFLSREGLDVAMPEVMDGRRNVLAVLPGAARGLPVLMLNGHLDTVPPSGSMRYPPFAGEVHDGALWGRGAGDMKGAVAAMACAMAALQRSGVRPHRSIVLAAVVAEESGNDGTAALCAEGPPASFAVVGEPTRLGLCLGHKGVDRYVVTVRGRTAHGATPERGISAILRAARLLAGLETRLPEVWRGQESADLGRASFNIGTIGGGVSRNTVPDRCTFTFDKRWVPGDSPERIKADLMAVADETIGRDAVEIVRDAEFDRVAHPPLSTAPDHPLARAVESAIAGVTGGPARRVHFDAFTDAAILHEAGTAAVICGPADLAHAHADDERVAVDELVAAARIYARVALRLDRTARTG